MVAYVTGTVNQELLLRNEYLRAEKRFLRVRSRVDCCFQKVKRRRWLRSPNSGIETSSSNTAVFAGHRPAAQSTPAGLDRVLRALRLIGAVPLAQAHQSDAGGLGDA